MTAAPRSASASNDRVLRFNLAVQWSRGALYVLSLPIAFAATEAGLLDLQVRDALVLMSVGVASAFVFHWIYSREFDRRLGVDLLLIWEAFDVLLITWTVLITGGATSLWYIFYLSNAAAAAFAGGPRAAYAVFGLNSLAYIGSLYAAGEIVPFDPLFYRVVFRMAFLFAASSFFFHGVAALKTKWDVIQRLAEDEQRRVEELTRLTRELDQRTRDLAAANRQIREADRMKSQFLANMSHELRTPMNSIIGFSEILAERLDGRIDERHMKFLGNIHSSGSHLLSIINDILDLSKIEAGKMELFPERFPVGPVVEGVCAVMRGAATKKDIRFDVAVPQELPAIEADAAKFKQVLYNLVANAVKFSHEHSVVRIEAERIAAEETPDGFESVVVRVIDHGIGIPRDQQSGIFTEFYQVGSGSRREHGGTGLGLALVKKFVELQQGDAGFSSVAGEGSTFWFRLPIQFRGASERSAELVAGPVENCVLVVEDDIAAWRSLEVLLTESGYAAIHARNGEEALHFAREARPVAITLDLVLPGMSGWHLLRALQSEPETRDIPVIIVSMIAHDELGLALGARDYIVKPWEPEKLVERIRSVTATAAPRM